MKTLIINLANGLAFALTLALLALAMCIPEPRWYNGRLTWGYIPEYDDAPYGLRCEGDCDESVPCRFCNP